MNDIHNIIKTTIDNLTDKTNFNLILSLVQQKIFQNNKNNILCDIDSLDKKISNNYDKIKILYPNLSIEKYKQYVYNEIQKDNYDTILLYTKSITRQNIYEPIQLSILEKYFNTTIYTHNKEKFNNTKTFDGISEDHRLIFQCKYINENGGNQDNQFNDLMSFNIEQTKYINYLVISGNYGITKIKKWLINNNLKNNTKIIILDDKITIIDNENKNMINYMSDIKLYNKYYSTNLQLIENINLFDILKSFNKQLTVIEPFAGDCDLLNIFKNELCKSKEIIKSINVYDITKINYSYLTTINPNTLINENYDTLINNIFFDNDQYFIITNPPYTAKNKLNQSTKMKYKSLLTTDIQDLYQIFIKQLINNYQIITGGCIIIPSNFMFGKQSKKIRNDFLNKYNIKCLNIFEKQTFDYTTQSVITLVFINKIYPLVNQTIHLYKSNDDIIDININDFNYILNFDIYNNYLCNNSKIIVKRNYNANDLIVSDIKVSLIDPKIEAYIDTLNKNIQDKITDRSFMRLCFNEKFDTQQEIKICELFNKTINELRIKTHSLVLTSYREYNRKRLTFEEVYVLMIYVINELFNI